MATMAVTASKLLSRAAKAARSGQAPLAGAFSVFMAVTYAPVAQAVDWWFEPRIGTTAIFSDNVNQSATNAENGLSLSVTPGFTLRSQGSRRVQASLQYGLSAVTRFGGNDDNDLYHNLNAAGKAELIEDFLFVDGVANVSQQLISLLGSPAESAINGANRATVGTYSFSPYVLKRFGTFATAQARYSATGAIFGKSVASNSSSNTFSMGLSSGTSFNDLNWALDYSNSKTNYSDTGIADSSFERASATVGYALSRKFRIFGTIGEDKNEYLSSTDTKGSFYRAGFGWSPSQRAGFEVSGGESYFGPTYAMSAHYRTRQTRWEAQYSQDVSDISRLALKLVGAAVNSCPAGTVLPPNYTLQDLINNNCDIDLYFGTSLTNNVFIYKLLTVGTVWDMSARTNLSVRLSDMTREFQLATQGEDRVQSIVVGVNHRLSPIVSATGGVSLIRNSLDSAATGGGAARKDDIASFSLGLNRRFNKDLNGALTFRHTQRDSNDANADYDENSITATANLRF